MRLKPFMRYTIAVNAAMILMFGGSSEALARELEQRLPPFVETCAGLSSEDAAARSAHAPEYTLGDSWAYTNYQVQGRRLNRTWTEKVTGVDAMGVEMTRIDRVPPDNIERTPYIYRKTFGDGVLNFPLTDGKRWTSEIIENGAKVGEGAYAVLGCETIRTEAGEFAAIKMTGEFTRGKDQYHNVMWFSPVAKNVVRVVYVERGKVVQSTDLASFAVR
jgi:hypothetical protein